MQSLYLQAFFERHMKRNPVPGLLACLGFGFPGVLGSLSLPSLSLSLSFFLSFYTSIQMHTQQLFIRLFHTYCSTSISLTVSIHIRSSYASGLTSNLTRLVLGNLPPSHSVVQEHTRKHHIEP